MILEMKKPDICRCLINYWNWSEASMGWQLGQDSMTSAEARSKLQGNLEATERNMTIPIVSYNNTLLSEKEYVDEKDGDG